MERLRRRAERALGGAPVKTAVAKVRAIIAPQDIPASEPVAQAALDKMREGTVPTDEELVALEIVIRLLRPVVLSRNGMLDDLPSKEGENLCPKELRDLWAVFRGRIAPQVGSVGRVELVNGSRHIGTGFLVADALLATNRHVLAALTFGAEALAPKTARVVFKQESRLPNSNSDEVPILGVAAIHPTLDMVLLRTPSTGRPPVDVAAQAVDEGTRIVALGYPASDPANNPLFLDRVFPPPTGVKRASLGEVLDGTRSPALYHDCSTTQGSSGSPLFDLATGAVVGIHRSGYFMYRNEAVDADDLRPFIASGLH